MAAYVEDASDLADFQSLLGACSTEVEASVSRCLLELADLVDACSTSVVSIRHRVEDTKQELTDRQRDLESANHGVASAESALSACNSQPPEEDGTTPNCSTEECELTQARQDFSVAQASVDEARQKLETGLRALDQSEGLLARARLESDNTRTSLQQCGLVFTSATNAAGGFLQNAVTRLREYSSGARPVPSPATAPAITAGRRDAVIHEFKQKFTLPDLSDFGGHTFPKTGIVSPMDLKRRFDLSPSGLGAFANELLVRDPRFAAEMHRRRQDYSAAKGPADRALVMAQVMRTTAGLFGERLVQAGLAPLGSKVVTQERTVTPEGNCTITDAVFYDINLPVLLGRGPGLFVPAGGALRCEVKARRAASLPGEKDHLQDQVSGGDPAHGRLVIVTRDIHELGDQEAGEFRLAARDAGAHTLALLPRKEELDAALWELVTRPTGNK